MNAKLCWRNVLFRRDHGPSSYFRDTMSASSSSDIAHGSHPVDIAVPSGTTSAALHFFFSVRGAAPPAAPSAPLHLFYVELEQNCDTGGETRLSMDLGFYSPGATPVSPTASSHNSQPTFPPSEAGAEVSSVDSDWVHVTDLPSGPHSSYREREYNCEIAWSLPAPPLPAHSSLASRSRTGSRSGTGRSAPPSPTLSAARLTYPVVYKRCQIVSGDTGEVLFDMTYHVRFTDPESFQQPTSSSAKPAELKLPLAPMDTSPSAPWVSPQTPTTRGPTVPPLSQGQCLPYSPLENKGPHEECPLPPLSTSSTNTGSNSLLSDTPSQNSKSKSWLRKT
ncbi:hypothetical protein BJ085DRAFT_39520, partial [Dimargaris cristalligena]